MSNYKNEKTEKLFKTMNEKWKFDIHKVNKQYRKQLSSRYKVMQIYNRHNWEQLFDYLKKNGDFLGYLIYEECSFREENINYTILEYIYLCNGFYCSITFNMSKKNYLNHPLLWGSEISISK